MANEIQSSVCIGSNAGRFQADADYIASENVFIGAECGDNVRNNTQCVVVGSQADVVGAATSEIVAVGRNAKAYNTGSVVIGANINDGDYSEAAIIIGETQKTLKIGGLISSDATAFAVVTPSAEPASGNQNASLLLQLGDPDENINGAPLQIWGGYATGTGKGSTITLEAGWADADGGPVIIYGGNSTDGTGGEIEITGGASDNGNGGDVYLLGGYAASFGGSIQIEAGEGTTDGGGNIFATCGAGGDAGGEMRLLGGYGPNQGGDISIGPGNADDAANNGSLFLTDGAGSTIMQISEEAKLGFYGATPIVKPTVTGNSAMEKANSIVAALAALGLIIDSTT